MLVEKDNAGRCERYLPVRLETGDATEAAPASIVRARITGRAEQTLIAVPA